jgi:DNA polymerase-3 subunit delta
MRYEALNEEIKAGKVRASYLFYGEEVYLRRQYRQRFKEALVKADDDMNYHYFEGNDTAVDAVIGAANTLPFLSDKRVIIWENSGLFAIEKKTEEVAQTARAKKKSEAHQAASEVMLKYLETLPESTVLLFVESKVDKRSRLFKFYDKNDSAVEFPVQSLGMLKKWVISTVKKEKKQISESTVAYLLDKTGTDMEIIHAELHKLVSFCYEREEISEADIAAVCTTQISNRIFAMIEAVAGKKQREALRLYYELLELREAPMKILSLLARQFNQLLQAKELKGKGYDNRSIAAKVGVPDFVVGKLLALASKFTDAQLRGAVFACGEADEAIKKGNLADQMSVELLIVRYSI